MEDPMVRLITFFAVLLIVGMLFYKSWRSAQPSAPPAAPKPKPRAKRPAVPEEFWMQVYDTDSVEEARKIQRKFLDSEVPCLVYQQGKKDVYGDRMKHYGVSVPREVMEKAQQLLTRITL
jgi:hypothetical protein